MEKEKSPYSLTVEYPLLNKIFIEGLLSKEEAFKSKFQEEFQDLFADIESFYGNPNCSCRGKIEKYVLSNKEKSVEFLNNFFMDNPSLKEELLNLEKIEKKYDRFSRVQRTKLIQEVAPEINNPVDNNFSGKSELVKINEWGNYIKKLREIDAKFFQFSTTKVDDDTIRVFFL